MLQTKQATFQSGSALSDIVDISGYQLLGIELPPVFDLPLGFEVFTFQHSRSQGGTYVNAVDDGNDEIMCAVAVAEYRATKRSRESVRGLQFVKLRSGTALNSVNQGSLRTVFLRLEEISAR